MELNRQIHLLGESREGVTLRLMDRCPGFEFGQQRPVVSFMQGEKSNVAMSNTIENMTIDVGTGNPGAIGLLFFANNSGAVRNVRIVSSSPTGEGFCGLEIRHEIVSGCFVSHLEVAGFDYGIRCLPLRNFMVFEAITLKNQRKVGFDIRDSIVSIRRLSIRRAAQGMRIRGCAAHVVMTDSEIVGDRPAGCAIDRQLGACFFRNIQTAGYGSALTAAGVSVLEEGEIAEYLSEEPVSLFPSGASSLPLPVEEPPEAPVPTEADAWGCVCDYGAVGDGTHDDTEAIRRAMQSGKPCLWFQPGRYLLNGPIEIPEHVVRVDFMYCDLIAGEALQEAADRGAFVVRGEDRALRMERLFAWEDFHGFMRLIEHAGKRALILADLHTQAAAMYFNTVEGGKVYLENCACTTAAFPYRQVPAFHFVGQRVWARHINPERSMVEILNDHSRVWVLGFKTESFGSAFVTIHGGHTEVLGAPSA